VRSDPLAHISGSCASLAAVSRDVEHVTIGVADEPCQIAGVVIAELTHAHRLIFGQYAIGDHPTPSVVKGVCACPPVPYSGMSGWFQGRRRTTVDAPESDAVAIRVAIHGYELSDCAAGCFGESPRAALLRLDTSAHYCPMLMGC
jgi:hypothetical protein